MKNNCMYLKDANNHIPGHLLLLVFPLNNPSVRSLECRKRSACKRLSINMVIPNPKPTSTFDVFIACFSLAWTSIKPYITGVSHGVVRLSKSYDYGNQCKSSKNINKKERKVKKYQKNVTSTSNNKQKLSFRYVKVK